MYRIGKEELKAIEDLFNTKNFFRYQGPGKETKCNQFEKAFAQYLGMKHSLMVTSGTNALILALRIANVGPGDEVLVPSYTFVATVAAVRSVGATPIVVNINETLMIDIESADKFITTKTKAIIPVHMDGISVDMKKVIDFAEKYKLEIIEDVAQAIGGDFNGKKLGSYGRFSCFSFNVDKIISCGEGGAIAFENEDDYKKALQLHDFPIIYGATYKDYLKELVPTIGYSMRVSEISGAIMSIQLQRLDLILKDLRVTKKQWKSLMKKLRHRIIDVDSNNDCSTYIHFRFDDPISAAEFAKFATSSGIVCLPLYARPAHCFWQWQQLLDGASTDHLKRDRINLSNVVRMEINIDHNEETIAKSVATLEAYVS